MTRWLVVCPSGDPDGCPNSETRPVFWDQTRAQGEAWWLSEKFGCGPHRVVRFIPDEQPAEEKP